MLKWLIVLISLLSAVAVAAPVWTWIDDQGRRHYSDRPVEGATRIEVEGTQTFSGAALGGTRNTQPTTPTTGDASEQPAASYSVLDIISPEPQETLHNIGANLPVELATYPPLQAGHRIDLILDGERRPIGARTLEITLPEVYRGEHTLMAVIIDSEGRELRRSMPVTFYVRQTSIINPP